MTKPEQVERTLEKGLTEIGPRSNSNHSGARYPNIVYPNGTFERVISEIPEKKRVVLSYAYPRLESRRFSNPEGSEYPQEYGSIVLFDSYYLKYLNF